jgi:catechol 2,3-dioxygenase-like lactoylglutathione lyase family enzyme
MANIDKHPAGSFCWIELATTDQNAAKKFYTSLFGWSVTDNPMGPGDFYSIFKLNGRVLVACSSLIAGQQERLSGRHYSGGMRTGISGRNGSPGGLSLQ